MMARIRPAKSLFRPACFSSQVQAINETLTAKTAAATPQYGNILWCVNSPRTLLHTWSKVMIAAAGEKLQGKCYLHFEIGLPRKTKAAAAFPTFQGSLLLV